jgi:hypothetical protein
MDETPRQRAKREGKAYVKILIEGRYATPKSARLEIEGAFDRAAAEAFYNAVWALLADATPALTTKALEHLAAVARAEDEEAQS